MKWINLQEQPPEIDSIVLVEYINGEYGKIEYLGDSEWWNKNVAKWLDEESNDPVFSLEDMRKSWEDGEFNGVYNFQQNLGSKDAATFKDFMKEQYKIEIP